MNEKPWVKPLEAFIADEDSFVVKQKRAQRYLRIITTKESDSKIYTLSEGVNELEKLVSLNTNDLGIHGFLYDRCTLDLFREFMSNSYFESQNMKVTARLIYLLDWFANSLQDNEMYKTSYDSLYHKQFSKIAEYNDHKDFNRRFITSDEFRTLPAVEHMAMIREDLENTRSFKNGIKEYDPKDLTKFVVSYVYSVLEKDYDTSDKINERIIPDWLKNFTSSKATSMGKTVLDWDEVDDDSVFDNDVLRALRMIIQFIADPLIDDSSIGLLFEEDSIKIASINILSYIHALMSYGIAIYNSFMGDQLKNLWFYPDYIVDYIYSTYQHARIDEAMIRYSTEITRVAVELTQCSINDLFTKLGTPTPVNPMPYNVPFSSPFCTAPSYPPLNPSLQHITMRLNQLETTVASLVGENAELKERIEKIEKLNGASAKIFEEGFMHNGQLSSTFLDSDKVNSCAHNNIVSYIYKNGIPKISVETFETDETTKAITAAINEWRNDVKKIVHFDTANDMIIEYDDGSIMKCRCKLCGKVFTIDRRLINKS